MTEEIMVKKISKIERKDLTEPRNAHIPNRINNNSHIPH